MLDVTPPDPVALAIQKAGGRDALAKALGITGPAISQWSRIPVERVTAISTLTGIPRSALRPDIYAEASE